MCVGWRRGLGVVIVVGEDGYFDVRDASELEICKDVGDCYSDVIVG